MKELKPGMLCLIVGARNPENNGKCVELIDFIEKGHEFIAPSGSRRIAGHSTWLVTGNVVSKMGEIGWALAFSKNLLPIGNDGDERIKSQQRRKQHAL